MDALATPPNISLLGVCGGNHSCIGYDAMKLRHAKKPLRCHRQMKTV
jgi:hypothetical protein